MWGGITMRTTIAILAALGLAACGSTLKATGSADSGTDTGGDLPDLVLVDSASDPDAAPDPVTDTPADTPHDTVDVPTDVPAGACAPVGPIECGTHVDASNDGPGSTDTLLVNDCYGATWTGPEIAWSLTFPDDLRAEIALRGLSADLDMFLFEDRAGACNPDACLATSLSGGGRDERMVYMGHAGETVYIVVDGYDDAVSTFRLEVDCVVPEDCDDDLDNDGDTVADCDDPECRWVLPCYEDVCDDAVDNDGDGPIDCDDFDCMAEPGCPTSCTPTADVSCGGRYHGDTRLTGTTDDVDRYSCSVWDESGPEDVTRFTAGSDARVTARISGLSVDLDVFVLEDAGGGCVNTGCIAFDNSTVSFDARAGHTYYVVIDGYMGVSGDYDLEIACAGP
jgi:hypothetical protein